MIILGDLNAKMGRPETGEEKRLLGEHCQPIERSGNGSLLARSVVRLRLVSLGGQRPPPHSEVDGRGYWHTRFDKPNKTYHVIDYALVSQGLASRHPKFQVDYTHLQSDHHLLCAWIDCPRRTTRKRGRNKPRRSFKLGDMIQKSSDQAAVEAARAKERTYVDSLNESFAGFEVGAVRPACPCPLDNCCCLVIGDFIARMEAALESSVGSVIVRRKFSRSWFDDEVKAAVRARREAYQEFKQSGSEEAWEKFTLARKDCNKITKRKQTESWNKFLEDVEDARHNDPKQMWNLIKRLIPNSKKASMSPITKADGSLALSEDEIVEAWAAHVERLGTPKPHPLENAAFAAQVEAEVQEHAASSNDIPDGEVDGVFTDEELKETLDSPDYHKACASDGTKNTMFKKGREAMAPLLLELFNHLRTTETFPDDWCKAVIVNLYKDGPRTDPGNYRGIALISCLGKIYLSLWAKRLTKYFDRRLSEAQGGFKGERGTEDQCLSFYEILLRRRRLGQPTFLFFVDFRKAFDTVWRSGLWKRLWDSGIQGKAWRVVRALYSNIRAAVKVGDRTSRFVDVLQGVRQGCPLSPTLFNCFVDELADRLRQAGFHGEDINLTVECLMYADDIVLLAESGAKLQRLINVVDQLCRDWHLDINLKKSQAMVSSNLTHECECHCLCAQHDGK